MHRKLIGAGSGGQHGSARIRSRGGLHHAPRAARSSTSGPSTHRAASAASPGGALPLGRSRRASKPDQRGVRPGGCGQPACPASAPGSERSRCVCRTSVRPANSPIRHIPLPDRNSPPARTWPTRCTTAEFSFIPTMPASSARTVHERQSRTQRGLAHVLGRSRDTPADGYPAHHLRHPRCRWRVRFDHAAPCLTEGSTPIRFWIKLNPGVDNDLVRIFVDGIDLGQCFTTWENYYRTSPEHAPPPNVNQPAMINSLQFRSSVQVASLPSPAVATCSTT